MRLVRTTNPSRYFSPQSRRIKMFARKLKRFTRFDSASSDFEPTRVQLTVIRLSNIYDSRPRVPNQHPIRTIENIISQFFLYFLYRLGFPNATQWNPRRRYSVLRDGVGLSTFATDLEYHRRREERQEQSEPASMSSKEYHGFVRARDVHGLGRPHSSTRASDGGRSAQVSTGSILRQTVSRELFASISFSG